MYFTERKHKVYFVFCFAGNGRFNRSDWMTHGGWTFQKVSVRLRYSCWGVVRVTRYAEPGRGSVRITTAYESCVSGTEPDPVNASLPFFSGVRRLVSGAGDIKLTKDGNVLLHEMVRKCWSGKRTKCPNVTLFIRLPSFGATTPRMYVRATFLQFVLLYLENIKYLRMSTFSVKCKLYIFGGLWFIFEWMNKSFCYLIWAVSEQH